MSPLADVAEMTVGVLTGGVSRERARSLLSGNAVYASLVEKRHRAVILDTASPDWTSRCHEIDVAFLAIAGQYAEDGKLQGFLETIGLPYTGSGVLASALGMDKLASKVVLQAAGLPVPQYVPIPAATSAEDALYHILSSLGTPVIIKPVSEGGSVDVTVADTPDDLKAQLGRVVTQPDRHFYAEGFHPGPTITVGLLEQNGLLKALPVLEIRTATRFYDYRAKRDPHLHEYRCPADLPDKVTKRLQAIACAAHRAVGCHGVSRVDLVLDARAENAYILELNTLPGLSHRGNLATMAKAAGISYNELISLILLTAFTKTSYVP